MKELEHWPRRIELLTTVERSSVTDSSKRQHSPDGSPTRIVNLLRKDPPKFRGNTLQEHTQWVHEVENTFTMFGVTDADEPQRALWTMKGLEGENMRKAQRKQVDVENAGILFTWPMLHRVIQDGISDPALRAAGIARQFFNTSIKPKQTLFDFQSSLEALEHSIDIKMSEEVRFWFYFVKLPDKIGNYLLLHDKIRGVKTVVELMDLARTAENLTGPTLAPSATEG